MTALYFGGLGSWADQLRSLMTLVMLAGVVGDGVVVGAFSRLAAPLLFRGSDDMAPGWGTTFLSAAVCDCLLKGVV
jgi:hypothetical protein